MVSPSHARLGSPSSAKGHGAVQLDDFPTAFPESPAIAECPLELRRFLTSQQATEKEKRKRPRFCPTAYEEFKRSCGLPPEARLFIINGNPHSLDLETIRNALMERGYVENVWDIDGPWFDIKWGLRHKNDYANLANHQLVNHYEKDYELCTKSGLASHLRDCSIYADHDSNKFCPPTFHLNSTEAIDTFAMEFMASKAMCVLKSWHAHIDSGAEPRETFQEGTVRIALTVSRRRHQDIDELLDRDANEAEFIDFCVRRSEWTVLREVDLENPAKSILALESQIQARLERERVDRQGQFLVERQIRELQEQSHRMRAQEEVRQCLKQKANCLIKRSRSTPILQPLGAIYSPMQAARAPSSSGSSPTSLRLMPAETVEAEVQERMKQVHAEELSGHNLLAAVGTMLEAMQNDPFYYDYGNTRNVWIMKPAGKLRGQGIFLEDDVDNICRHAHKMKGDGNRSSYVCQQYIENPLLIGGQRKHDIRQWVAITSLNPLTVWFFNECYVRLAATDYTMDDITDLFTHLNNNAIISQHEKYDPEDEYWRCQWDEAQYRKLLREQFGSDVWTEKVLPQMKEIVITTMKSVQESMSDADNHNSGFQLLGYDFLVDSDLGVWLLEVNNNPLMHASCPVTERLCDPCLKDLLRVALDGDDGRRDRDLRFDLLFEGPRVPELQQDMSSHHEMFLEGRRIGRPSPAQNVQSEVETKATAQRLQARREQELQELSDRKKKQREKEQQKVERSQRIRTKLREKFIHRHPLPSVDMLLKSPKQSGVDMNDMKNSIDGPVLARKLLESSRHMLLPQSKSTPSFKKPFALQKPSALFDNYCSH